MITKGIRISQLVERKDLNGKEIMPFQDGIHNGKLSIQSLIDYIVDISDSDLKLQALIKIQKFVDTVSEMDLLLYQAKEGDIYYCKENKKLYVRSFNKWDMLDPLTSKVYVLVGLDEYNRTNIIHLWDGNDMVVMSERLFIGEVTGTAYDGGKGKHLADIANSLPDNVIREVADFTTDGSTVTFNYEYDVKQESGLFDGDAQGSKTIPSATTSNAGVMSATDKVKLDVTLPNDIKAEEDARKTADSTLQGNIDSSNSDLNSKIAAETKRATQADSTLQSNIDNEAIARSKADATLGSKISKEFSDRTQAVSTLQDSLDTEIARATKAEQDITSAYETADTALQNNINAINNSKGVANGIATLDQNGLVPSSQLPSYVDDVIEVSTFSALPGTGESGKIYITQDTNLTYRWSGTAYVEISQSLALGETSSTAYAGDKGKATTDKVNRMSDKVTVGPNNTEFAVDNVKLWYVTHKTSTDKYSQDSHMISAATTTQAGIMTAADKTKLNGLKDQAGITSDINAVQTNLETHINNKSNPHEVTKDQVGLGNVDNTSDANKPISTATQNALNSKFNASDGNALKQTIENMPNLVVTEGRLSHKNNGISLSLRQQDLKDQVNTDSILLKFKPATDNTAGIILPSDKTKIDKIITNGNGTKYLSDNGTYKEVSGGGGSGEQYYKINNDKFLPYLRTPAYYKDTDAETAITYVFNTVDKFKEFIDNALDNGYVLEFINGANNEKTYIRDYHAYRSSYGNYELSFIFIYSENGDNFALVTTRVFMSYNASYGYKFIVVNLVQSDNLTTITKKTSAEYEAIGSKDAQQM